MKTINVTAGDKEFVGGTLSESRGKDISSNNFQIGFSTSPTHPPATWQTPTVNQEGPAGPSSRTVMVLVDTATPPGSYWCWVHTPDDPEVISRAIHAFLVR